MRSGEPTSAKTVPRRRARLVVAAAVIPVALVAGAGPASAHSCAETVTVVEDVPTDVTLTVTLEDLVPEAITLEFEYGLFEITEDVTKPGWRVEQEKDVIRFSEGELEANSCVTFDVPIKALEEGTYRVRAFQHVSETELVEVPAEGDAITLDDGSTVMVDREGPPNEAFDQIIVVTPGEEESSSRPWLIALAVVGVVGVIAIFAWPPSRRRTRA